jgi:hypothetical protein
MSVSTSSVPPGETDGRTGDPPALAVELQVVEIEQSKHVAVCQVDSSSMRRSLTG